MYKLVIFLFVLVFTSYFATANFACGEINPGNYSADWLSVSINYRQSPMLKSSCDISPSNNKYCCDPRSINGVSWSIGKVLDARILDNSGYFTESVNLTISGQGFDVFPLMELKKAVTIKSPNSSVILNNGSFRLDLVSSYPFRLVNYSISLNGLTNTSELCNCTNQSLNYLNFESGKYQIIVYATDGRDTLYDSINFTLVDFLSFERKISCEGCEGRRIPPNTLVNVTVHFNASHELFADLYDYFPKDWGFKGEEALILGNTHNAIHWKIEGSSGEKSYLLRSPYIRYPRKYTFVSAINGIYDASDIFLVSSWGAFFSLFSLGADSLSKESRGVQTLTNLRNDLGKPLVLNVSDDFISEVSLFPKEFRTNSNIYFKNYKKSKRDVVHEFLIGSDISSDEVEYIFIKLKVDKNILNRNKLSPENLTLYLYEDSAMEEQEIIRFIEQKNNYYYEIKASKTGNYMLMERLK